MTIPDSVRRVIERAGIAFVASTDAEGSPHLAAGTDLKVEGGRLLFDNWFCTTTLRNVARNPRVAVVVTSPEATEGFQLLGLVIDMHQQAILNGFIPGGEKPETPQALIMLTVQVEKIMEFSARIHTDLAMEQT